MSAGYLDLYIEQGATYYQPIAWKDGSGNAVNLTGYTARMQIRKTVNSTTVIIELNTENGRITLGGAAGTVTLNITAEDTADLEQFAGVYDLELEASNGFVIRLLEGQVTVSKEVTREVLT